MNASSKVCQALELVASTWGSVFLLDGGTGEELLARGIPVDRKIWSATAIVNSCYHSTLLQVHRSYLDSGAQAITTNSYGIVPGVGFTDEEIVQHCSAAGRLARQAIEEYEHDHHSITDAINDNYKCNSHDYVSHNKIEPFALGSLGPLVESYRPDKVMVRDRGVAVYSRMVSAMAPYVDAFLAETLSSTEEAMQVIESLASTDCRNTLPLLISFTVNSEGNLRSGETVVGSLSRVLQCSLQHHVKRKCFDVPFF